MDRYLEKKLNQTDRNDWNLGRLDPDEVWLSDGNLLVLRGGATSNRKSFDDPLAPLDDFVAPYRYTTLPRNKRFLLKFLSPQNASKFAIF